ncbi:MAG: hypothetical protein QGH11_11190, partial [Pirellulaceae bacterium]|nr:hypothetical protein [Pirellulaceae bacterium]
YQNQALVLFTFDSKEHVAPVCSMKDLKPENDWILISLVPPQARKERKEKEGGEPSASQDQPADQEPSSTI